MTNAIELATTDIETVVQQCNAARLREMPILAQTVTLATGMQKLRQVLTKELVEQVFMPLQGTALGFVTDKDRDQGYPPAIVRDCMVEAMIFGLRPIGNEINIIAGRMYAAKNGLIRLVNEFPGISDVVVTPGAPVQNDKEARVSVRASWKVNGVPGSMIRDATKREDGSMCDERFVIRVNAGMGADAIIGKALRKAYKAIYDILVGGRLAINDGDVTDTVGVEVASESKPIAPPEQDGKRMHLGNKKPETKTAPSTEPDRGDDPNNY